MLVLYLVCCVAVLVLRKRNVATGGTPFSIPGGPVVPVLAIAAIVWLLVVGTCTREATWVGVTLLVGAILYVATGSLRAQSRGA